MRKAWLIRMLYFLVFCCTASWLPVLADFCQSKGLSGTQTSLVLSTAPVMMLLVQPFYGMVADRLGYKRTLIFSSLLAALSFLAYLNASTFGGIVVVTILMSLFYNTLQPVIDTLSLKLAGEDPLFSYGTLRTAGAAGWAVTGILTGYVIDHINISSIFIISATSMFLVCLVAFFLQDDDARSGNDVSYSNATSIMKQPNMLFLLLCVFLVSAGATTIWNFYSLYMKENGASAQLVGFGLSFQGLCEIPLFYFSARIIFRLGLKGTLLLTVSATVLRLVLYAMVRDPYMALPIELLHGLSWSLFWVACVELVGTYVAPQWLATGQSLLYAAYYGAGAIAGNYWTGWLYDNHMKLSSIFMINAGIVMIVVILIALFLKPAVKPSTA